MIENDYLRNEIMKLTTKLNMPVYVVSLEDGTNFVMSDLFKAKNFIFNNFVEDIDIDYVFSIGDCIEDSETLDINGRTITISKRNIL